MNPNTNIHSSLTRVGPETEHTFDVEFFENLRLARLSFQSLTFFLSYFVFFSLFLVVFVMRWIMQMLVSIWIQRPFFIENQCLTLELKEVKEMYKLLFLILLSRTLPLMIHQLQKLLCAYFTLSLITFHIAYNGQEVFFII